LEEIGEKKGGYSISQVALAWHLSNPVITSPIIGPRNMEQLEDNIGAVGLRITNDEMEQLNQASEWREG
jgi:aryl-alcohol dehydrogenase-like predicted oxidoreductase